MVQKTYWQTGGWDADEDYFTEFVTCCTRSFSSHTSAHGHRVNNVKLIERFVNTDYDRFDFCNTRNPVPSRVAFL